MLFIIILLVVAFIVTITLYVKVKKNEIFFRKQVIELDKLKKSAEKKAEEMYNRVKEVEDGVGSQFGVKLRKEVTNIVCDFSDIELAIMMAGINKLVISDNQNHTIDDRETFIILYKKIQSVLEKMEESERKNNAN